MSRSSILDKCCLLGESVSGNPTHFMIEQALAAADLDWRFLTFEAEKDRLGDALRGIEALGFRGALLLPSFQQEAYEHIVPRTTRAEQTHSISCLREVEGLLTGDDLAGVSVVSAVADVTPVAGRHALLLGTEGRAAAVAHALIETGVARLWSLDLVESIEGVARNDPLLSHLRDFHPDASLESLSIDDDCMDLPSEIDLVISTASWEKEQDNRVAKLLRGTCSDKMTVVDARIRSGRTPLLRDANQAGAQVVSGARILAAEAAEAIQLWTGIETPRTLLHEAAEEFLGV